MPCPARCSILPSTAAAPEAAQAELFDQVLCLEQMMTTGGGWQDQVGGLVGGIKLLSSRPGLPQQIRIEPLQLPPEVCDELAARLLLVYTGQQRLAKNLLRAMMRRWMARDRAMVNILSELGRLAVAMRDALSSNELDLFGALLAEHWLLNKRMDPGCSNPFIDQLLAELSPHLSGAKLAGAGGGGFIIGLARSRQAALDAQQALAEHYAGSPVGCWPCAVAHQGLA